MMMERTLNIRIDQEEAEVDNGRRSEGTSEEVKEERVERKEDGDLDEVKRSSLSNDIECFKRELALELQATSQQLPRDSDNADQQIQASTNKQLKKLDDEEVQSEYNYQQLSHKLSTALCKIQSKQRIKTQSFLDRVEYFQKKKAKVLKQKIEEKEQQSAKLSIKPPLTNAHSERMLQQYQPIQNRYERILQEKRKKIEKQMEDKRIRQQKEIEEHIKQVPKKLSNARSNEQFFSSINSWKEKRQKKIVAKTQEDFKSEMEGVTFQPVINTKSKIMVKRIGKVPIYQQPIKPKKIEFDKACTFQPNLIKSKR